jgi:hypothetical protein
MGSDPRHGEELSVIGLACWAGAGCCIDTPPVPVRLDGSLLERWLLGQLEATPLEWLFVPGSVGAILRDGACDGFFSVVCCLLLVFAVNMGLLLVAESRQS